MRRSDAPQWMLSIPFWGMHVAALAGIIWLGVSPSGILLSLACYVVLIFGVTAGYHRYFSHRTYKTSRVFQFVLAVLAEMSVQKGVLWWAAHHRRHHKYSDLPNDVHSMKLDGFYYSHVGWILSKETEETDMKRVGDLAKYPELVWLNKHFLVPPIALAIAMYAVGGMHALVWGFFVSTVITWHGTFTINSLAHWLGKRRYNTTDDSKNSWILAILTLGEGWHNNHHYYQRSVRQGFFWWEIDVTYYVLRTLAVFGIVWDLHAPPAHVLNAASAGEKERAARPSFAPSVPSEAPAAE